MRGALQPVGADERTALSVGLLAARIDLGVGDSSPRGRSRQRLCFCLPRRGERRKGFQPSLLIMPHYQKGGGSTRAR